MIDLTAHRSEEFSGLVRMLKRVAHRIQEEYGGEIEFLENRDLEGFLIIWKKYEEETNKVLKFNYAFSYRELVSMNYLSILEEFIMENLTKNIKKGIQQLPHLPQPLSQKNDDSNLIVTFFMWGQKCTCVYIPRELSLIDWLSTCYEKGYMAPEDVKLSDGTTIYSKEDLDKMKENW